MYSFCFGSTVTYNILQEVYACNVSTPHFTLKCTFPSTAV